MIINIRQGTAEDGGFMVRGNMHVTRRELEALALIGMGLSNAEAAEKLGVSVNTVRNHVWNLMQKLGANSRAHAIALAVQNGIIEVEYERSLETFVRGVDRYRLCIICGRAALEYDYKDVEPEKVTINHVEYDVVRPPQCPTGGCRGDISLTLEWDTVRKHHAEYPEIPGLGVAYDYDIKWLQGYPND